MSEIVDECCGLPGTLVGAGSVVRGRCLRHEHVVDAGDWLRARSEMTCAFESEEELMLYFLSDCGAAVDVMQEMTRDDDDTRH